MPNNTNDRQHPVIKVHDLKDDFAISYYAGGSPEPKSLEWAKQTLRRIDNSIDEDQIAAWQKQLKNYRKNYNLYQDQMSLFVNFTDIPPQWLKNIDLIQEKIDELELKLGFKGKKKDNGEPKSVDVSRKVNTVEGTSIAVSLNKSMNEAGIDKIKTNEEIDHIKPGATSIGVKIE